MVSTMRDGIVFAMANPTPEIMPDEAKAGGAKVVATGRSDFPNQINNVLVFPGIFKGALAARAPQITEEMEIAAAEAIASLVPEDKLSPDFIIPSALDKTVADVVAKAVFISKIRRLLRSQCGQTASIARYTVYHSIVAPLKEGPLNGRDAGGENCRRLYSYAREIDD